MKRNCNLELRLVTPSVFTHSSSEYNDSHYNSMLGALGGDTSPNETQQQQQQITIFYNGRIASCDVTELQARSIISVASKEMQDRLNNSPRSEPPSPALRSPLYSPTTASGGLSMKRSLQMFLQKRKDRAQATSPYPIPRHPNPNY